MSRSLVIVESPAKARTIEKILGRRYKVAASMGHVRDLPKSQFGVDPERGFEPRYITIRGKGPILNKLRAAAQKADRVLLATDPDREGEAISWHLAQALGLDPDEMLRVVFREVTSQAVQEAVQRPRGIDYDLVNAQQARRILDRLVGYQLSPLLWRKVRRGLSAGRVQSVAVRLVVDRELEIEAFQPEEYWSLTALLEKSEDANIRFQARYHGDRRGKKTIADAAAMEQLLHSLENRRFVVEAVKRRQRRRNPAPAFTTSSLQQEASRKLRFAVRRTMRVAQQLYEGLDIPGRGTVGLITYMRTDSTRVAAGAAQAAADLIEERYGKEFVGKARRGKAGAQDAHEAIRPTAPDLLPEEVKKVLTGEQYRLYRLIWERFMASQMAPAVMDTVTVDIAAQPADGPGEAKGNETKDPIFRATGSVVKFPGFMQVYVEGTDNEQAAQDHVENPLPELAAGQLLLLRGLLPKQHFTQPPARFTEASLVKALEENGIGRPSTYAPIIETIQDRGYVEQDSRRFRPTDLGRIVTDLLKEHFPNIIDIEFTAQMEDELDAIGEAGRDWRSVLQGFYDPFAQALEEADEAIKRVELPVEETDEVCEHCGRNMVIKHGRFGRFLACPGYPECKNTKPLLEKTGARCPDCGEEIVVRRSRRGRTFFGCSGYPDCKFVTWYRPTSHNCPQCEAFLVEKGSKRQGKYLACVREECGYTQPLAAANSVTQKTAATANGTTGAGQGSRDGEEGRGESRSSEEEVRLGKLADHIVAAYS